MKKLYNSSNDDEQFDVTERYFFASKYVKTFLVLKTT